MGLLQGWDCFKGGTYGALNKQQALHSEPLGAGLGAGLGADLGAGDQKGQGTILITILFLHASLRGQPG